MEALPVTCAGKPGPLIAIGGAEDKVRERIILRYFLEVAGGSDASVVVLATASEVPETGERYADLFYSLNADSVEVLRIISREDALAAGAAAHELPEDATGLVLTGGRQLRLPAAPRRPDRAAGGPGGPPAGAAGGGARGQAPARGGGEAGVVPRGIPLRPGAPHRFPPAAGHGPPRRARRHRVADAGGPGGQPRPHAGRAHRRPRRLRHLLGPLPRT